MRKDDDTPTIILDRSFFALAYGAVDAWLLVIGGIFLIVEHLPHVALGLPYVLLLLCPLIHLFMHRGHGEGHKDGH